MGGAYLYPPGITKSSHYELCNLFGVSRCCCRFRCARVIPASPVQPAGPSKTHRSRTYIVHGGDVAASAAARCMSRDSRSPSFDMYVVCVEENEGGTTFRDPPPPLLLLPPSHAVQVAVENLHSTAAPTSLWTMVGLGWRSRYGSWAVAGRILLLMAGLVWIFRVAVVKRPTAGNADGMHAPPSKRGTESSSRLRLDRGGRNNSLRVNDSRSATISRGISPLLVTAPHASAAPAGIVFDAVVVKSCPSKKSKLRPAAALPSLGRREAASKLQCVHAGSSSSSSHCTARSHRRVARPPRLAWVG